MQLERYLILFVVSIVLSFLCTAVFLQFIIRPEQTTFRPNCYLLNPGFRCINYSIEKDGRLNLQISQATGHVINITGLSCIEHSPAPKNFEPVAPPLLISDGETAVLANATEPGKLHYCYLQDGTTKVSANVSFYSGFYIGSLFVHYSESGSGEEKLAYGDMIYEMNPIDIWQKVWSRWLPFGAIVVVSIGILAWLVKALKLMS